jgi:hypothetical protein
MLRDDAAAAAKPAGRKENNAMSNFEILDQLHAGNVAQVIARLEAEQAQYERYVDEQETAYLLRLAAAEELGPYAEADPAELVF